MTILQVAMEIYDYITGCYGDGLDCYTCMTPAPITGFPGQYLTQDCGQPFKAREAREDSDLFAYCMVSILIHVTGATQP